MKDVVNDYTSNGHTSVDAVSRRIALHLEPFFGGRRMATITTADVRAYTAVRLDAKTKPASINRQLAILKRAFTLALRAGTLVSKPHIPMLEEHNARQGFSSANSSTPSARTSDARRSALWCGRVCPRKRRCCSPDTRRDRCSTATTS